MMFDIRFGLLTIGSLAAVVGIVCTDIVAIPGIAHDNPQLAGKIAAYIVLGAFNVFFAGVVTLAWKFALDDDL